MRVLGREVSLPRALLASLIALVVVTVVVAGFTSTAAFGAYNPAWDGTTAMRGLAADETDTRIVREVSEYVDQPANRSVAFIFSPTQVYEPDDAARIRQFVQTGGTLVVAEDFGFQGNRLLENIGVETRFDGALVRDERHHYRGPSLPVATNVSTNRSLTTGIESLTLNHGTVLEPGADATVLVRTSPFAYRDVNRNGTLDDAESMTTYPVVTVESVDEGRVVVVSDPSLFVNAMLERSGNRDFASALVADQDVALFDYSHSGGLPPLAAAVVAIRGSPVLAFLLGTLGVLVLGLWGRGDLVGVKRGVAKLARRGEGRESPVEGAVDLSSADVVASVTRRHPDWDTERVERIAEEITRRRENEGPPTDASEHDGLATDERRGR